MQLTTSTFVTAAGTGLSVLQLGIAVYVADPAELGIYLVVFAMITLLANVSKLGFDSVITNNISTQTSLLVYSPERLFALIQAVAAAGILIVYTQLSEAIALSDIGSVLAGFALVGVNQGLIQQGIFRATQYRAFTAATSTIFRPLANIALLFMTRLMSEEQLHVEALICCLSGAVLLSVVGAEVFILKVMVSSSELKSTISGGIFRNPLTILKSGARFGVPSIMLSASDQVVLIAVGHLYTPSEVGTTLVSNRLAALCMIGLTAASNIYQQDISRYIAEQDFRQLQFLLKSLRIRVLVMALLIAAGAVLFGPTVLALINPEFAVSEILIIFLAIVYCVAATAGPCGYLGVLLGFNHKIVQNSIIGIFLGLLALVALQQGPVELAFIVAIACTNLIWRYFAVIRIGAALHRVEG